PEWRSIGSASIARTRKKARRKAPRMREVLPKCRWGRKKKRTRRLGVPQDQEPETRAATTCRARPLLDALADGERRTFFLPLLDRLLDHVEGCFPCTAKALAVAVLVGVRRLGASWASPPARAAWPGAGMPPSSAVLQVQPRPGGLQCPGVRPVGEATACPRRHLPDHQTTSLATRRRTCRVQSRGGSAMNK